MTRTCYLRDSYLNKSSSSCLVQPLSTAGRTNLCGWWARSLSCSSSCLILAWSAWTWLRRSWSERTRAPIKTRTSSRVSTESDGQKVFSSLSLCWRQIISLFAYVFAAKVRRLYDIANVLRSLKLIEKVHVTEERGRKPAFEWVGPVELPQVKGIARPRFLFAIFQCWFSVYSMFVICKHIFYRRRTLNSCFRLGELHDWMSEQEEKCSGITCGQLCQKTLFLAGG